VRFQLSDDGHTLVNHDKGGYISSCVVHSSSGPRVESESFYEI